MTAVAVAWFGGTGSGKVHAQDAVGTALGYTSLTQNTTNFVEGTASSSEKVSNTTIQGYSITAADFTGEPWNFASGQKNDGDHIFVWLSAYEAWDSLANGGFRIRIADDLATDSVGTWYVGPQPGFLGGWYAYVINPAASFNEVTAGSASWTTNGNPAQLTGVDGFGAGWKITKSISGAVDNCFVDAMTVGQGYVLTLGDAGSTEGKFSDFTAFEEVTATGRFGGVRGLSGIVFARCKLAIGAASGSTNTEFIDSGFTVVWEKALLSDGASSAVASTFYELRLQKGSGSTTVSMSSGSLAAVAPHTVVLNFAGSTSAALSAVNVDRGGAITLDAAVTWTGSLIVNSGQIAAAGATFTDNTVSGYTGAANTSSLVWNVATDPDGKLDACMFVKGAAAHHAIEFGTSSPTTMTLTNVNFSGYNASDGQNDSAIHIKRTTGTVTINIDGGTTPSYKSDGATVVIVSGSVTAACTVTTAAGAAVQDARVFVKAAAGGPFPYQASVTIVNSGSTATVTHTSHGLATNDKVLIAGASHAANNGVFAITKVDNNSYTYTMGSSPGSNPTGTITSTFVVLAGLTDASGRISMSRVFPSDQAVTGVARKSSAAPYYKSAPINGTVDSGVGAELAAVLVSDT